MQYLKEFFEIDEIVHVVGDYPNIYFQDNCINYNVDFGSTRGFRVSISVCFKNGNKLEAIN
jgi:hypothetical protein